MQHTQTYCFYIRVTMRLVAKLSEALLLSSSGCFCCLNNRDGETNINFGLLWTLRTGYLIRVCNVESTQATTGYVAPLYISIVFFLVMLNPWPSPSIVGSASPFSLCPSCCVDRYKCIKLSFSRFSFPFNVVSFFVVFFGNWVLFPPSLSSELTKKKFY